jgi:hypothetical protein
MNNEKIVDFVKTVIVAIIVLIGFGILGLIINFIIN